MPENIKTKRPVNDSSKNTDIRSITDYSRIDESFRPDPDNGEKSKGERKPKR